ncbi:hypothetical protein RJ640_016175, partial [Escallonia rubra]
GIDTRFTFTDHLYTALVGAGWNTFRDEEEIDRGEEIELELKKAIPDSRCSVVVFSENYASSVWCLDELVMIMERRRTSNHVVIPVFYHVDPSVVRYQQGSFGKALATQEERFKARKRGSEDDWRERTKGWREALKNAAGLGGLDLKNQADRYESKFIQKIVEDVDSKLPHTHLSIPQYLVGIDYQLESISSWLKNGPSDIGIMAIWGTAGIGKTTIAKRVFDLNLGSFDAGSFLENVTKTSKESHGILGLQKQLISEILMGKKRKIRSADEGVWKIRQVMARKRVLIVLDDVEEEDLVTQILGTQKWFCKGSKIVITTRDRQFIRAHRDDKIHKVPVDTLLEAPSLKLFCMHAFEEEDPPENYRELTNRVLAHCGGLPLALRTLGRLLSCQSLYEWERTLENLKTIPERDIQKKLEISYNSLKSDFDKNLFLDIACFFVGKDKNLVVKILDERDFCPLRGIENLKDRGLLSVDKNNKLRMHQLLQQMGRELIRQKEPNELGKRCRLWHHEDSFNVLKENTGTRAIRGLDLGLHMEGNLANQHGSGYAFSNWNEVQLKTSSFTMMSELRLLLINYVQLTGGYEKFPRKLRWLCWHGFPLTSIPTDFPLESLVVIDMRNSHLTRFWNGTKAPSTDHVLRFLKILNLSHCQRLSETPDFSILPNLEKLILKECYSLLEVHESIGHLETRLVLLNLNGCKSLKELPRAIGRLKVLETLIISGCSSLDHLPREIISMIASLTKFLADDINLGVLVPTPKGVRLQEEATSQEEATLQEEATSQEAQIVYLQIRQASFPFNIIELSLVDCNLSDDAFSGIKFDNRFSLKTLDLSGNPISFLPDSIKSLISLKSLRLEHCRRLKSVEMQSGIRRLDVHDCTALERISVGGPREECRINSLGCEQLVEITNHFKLEPLENVDAETANHLQLYGLQSTLDREMTTSFAFACNFFTLQQDDIS